MTRKLKIRVWDTEYKQWVSYSEYQSLPDDFIRFKDNDPLFELCAREGSEGRFVIQQYTGLKDKNGKEIYEGDIVTTIYPDQKTGEIVYTPEVGAYRVKCGQQLLPIVTYRIVEGETQGRLINVAVEIVGNINYKNETRR